MADGDRTNLGNFPDDFDDDEQDALEAAPETPESEAPVAPPDGPPAEPPAGDTPGGPPPSPPAPAAASADELAQLRQEIAFLRQGQAPAAPSAPAAPQAPDVLGMIDNYLGPYKPKPAEMLEALQDPSGEKLAELFYNVARVSTGAGAALGLQAAQNQTAQQRAQEQMYQARGEAFRAAYPQLQKYGTVVQHHAGQVHAELTARGQQVPPQMFAAEVARRASADLKQNFGIDPDAQPRKQRMRPATAERGTSATNGVAPRAKGGRRQDQIGKFLGLH